MGFARLFRSSIAEVRRVRDIKLGFSPKRFSGLEVIGFSEESQKITPSLVAETAALQTLRRTAVPAAQGGSLV